VKTGEPDDEGGKPRPEGQAEEERASPSEDDGRRRHPRGRIEADIGDRGEEMHRRDMEVAGEDESRRREDAARDVVAEDSRNHIEHVRGEVEDRDLLEPERRSAVEVGEEEKREEERLPDSIERSEEREADGARKSEEEEEEEEAPAGISRLQEVPAADAARVTAPRSIGR